METENRLQHDRLADLLADLEREHGVIEAQVIKEVRRAWPASGPRASRHRGA